MLTAMAVRSALRLLGTNRRTTSATITVLTSSSTAMSSSTSGSCVSSRRRSSSMPTETKNRPSRMSWNGLMTASVWCLNSVSASSMPARNPPSAIDRPIRSVAQAASNDTNRTVSVKISVLR